MNQKENQYHNFEYKKLKIVEDDYSAYVDGYRNFGWIRDENVREVKEGIYVTVALKRNRQISNKAELTRLQQNFEDYMKQIKRLYRFVRIPATVSSALTGIAGTALLIIAIWIFCDFHRWNVMNSIFAVMGIVLQTTALFVYKKVYVARYIKIGPFIEAKRNELYEICDKGRRLLE
jgi:hypothetical protein